MRRYLQPNQVAEVIQLFQDGTSIHAVARRFAASPSTIPDTRRLAVTQGELNRAIELRLPSVSQPLEFFPSRQPPTTLTRPAPEPEPMQLSRPHLIPEERLRSVFQGVFVLRSEGPLHRVLPPAPKSLGSPAVEERRVSRSFPSSHKRFSIQASLCSSSVPLPLSALVNSGAEDNFIDEVVVRQAGFPTEPLETSIIVRALDGKLLARIAHQTTPLQLILSGNHHRCCPGIIQDLLWLTQ
ncbi:hypothetical protein L3Q82_001767 [Scomber scombrus]|uniref:DUF4817 domain-containing protein n=1 Tax=Scomber scombrus TaxID=13677 RepID=A0AAV1NDG7_SCOSC